MLIIWSKENCSNCVKAKNFLAEKGILYEERKIDNKTWTVTDLLTLIPNAKSVPQIFDDEVYVGGFNELLNYV